MRESAWCSVRMAFTQPNAEQVHALIEEAWIPTFKMHELGTKRTWEPFEASFGEHILATSECSVNEFNGEKVNNA